MENTMSIRKERLQLIRERHRKLILAPREQVQMEAFADDWEDGFDCFDDDDFLPRRRPSSGMDEEE